MTLIRGVGQRFGVVVVTLILTACAGVAEQQSCERSQPANLLKPLIVGNELNTDLMVRNFPRIEQYLMDSALSYQGVPVMDYLNGLQAYVSDINHYPVKLLAMDLACAGIPDVDGFNVLNYFDAVAVLSGFQDSINSLQQEFSSVARYHKAWNELEHEFDNELSVTSALGNISVERIYFYATATTPYTYIALRFDVKDAGQLSSLSRFSFILKDGNGGFVTSKVVREKTAAEDSYSGRPILELAFKGVPDNLKQSYQIEIKSGDVGVAAIPLPARLVSNRDLYVIYPH